MKKTLFIAAIIISILLVSCKSAPPPSAAVTEVTDQCFYEVYSRYIVYLILDGAQHYTVQSGDRLVDISKRFYPDGYYYPVIMLASREIVLDPDKIQPGMVLTIPDLELNKGNDASKNAVRGVIRGCADLEDIRNRHETARGLREHADSF